MRDKGGVPQRREISSRHSIIPGEQPYMFDGGG